MRQNVAMVGSRVEDRGTERLVGAPHDGHQAEAQTEPGLALLKRWCQERPVLLTGVVIATVTAIWMTSDVWGGRAPGGDDVMGHLARTEFAIRHLISDGQLTGWDPRFILGYEEFLFLGPGFTWAVALVQAVSLGLLSVPGAFKVVVIGSFVAVPLSVAFLARSFGLGQRAAAAAAILSLAVNSNFGGMGVLGLFGIGLVPHQFAAPVFFLTLGGILRVLRKPSPRWIVFTTVMLAALVISHGRSVVVLAVVVVIVLATMFVAQELERRRPPDLTTLVSREVGRQLRQAGLRDTDEAIGRSGSTIGATDALSKQSLARLITVGVIAFGLSAFILVPLVAHRDLQGVITAWANVPFAERFGQIWRGETLFRPHIALLLAAGFAYGLIRYSTADRRYVGAPYALAVAVTPIAYLAAAHAAVNIWPGNVITAQLPDRGLGFAGVLAVLPLSTLVGRISRSLEPVGGAVAMAVALAIVIVPLDQTLDVAKQTPEPVPQMQEAASQLARLVPEGARFVTQRDFPGEIGRTGLTHPDFWLAWASGRNTLNSFSVESTTSAGPAYESEHILDRPPDAVADALSRLGVTHLVTVSDAAAAQVSASSRFEEVWRSSPLAIFAVSSRAGQPEPAALVTASSPVGAGLVNAEPEHMVIQLEAPTATTATVAVGWSPKWHASLDGREVPLRPTDDGLLSLDLPPGESRLELDFRPDQWDWLGRLMTILTIGALLVWRFRLRDRFVSQHAEGQAAEPSDGTVTASPTTGEAVTVSHGGGCDLEGTPTTVAGSGDPADDEAGSATESDGASVGCKPEAAKREP